MVAERAQRLFTIEEYECMIRAGILREGERVELFEGRIFQMAAMGGPHWTCIVRCDRSLKRSLPATVDVCVQMPIRLPTDSEPEPDISVVRHRADDYLSGMPGPEDILLLIEISDSSLAFDRDQKLPRYAVDSIPEVWLADLPGDRIWLYRTPRNGHYEDVSSVGRGETLAPLAFPDLLLAVDDLLPPATPWVDGESRRRDHREGG